MNKEVKIIWHFKEEVLTPEEMDKIENKIKDFHKNSLIAFSENLEITIIE